MKIEKKINIHKMLLNQKKNVRHKQIPNHFTLRFTTLLKPIPLLRHTLL